MNAHDRASAGLFSGFSSAVLVDCAQLVKANSIEGNVSTLSATHWHFAVLLALL